ncbi:MAG: tRNA (guanosine-2'-O-)-methyltransferase [Flavobacteriales bacterium]|jgi:tRNA (guanosine-2'-O-)-methyltransferase
MTPERINKIKSVLNQRQNDLFVVADKILKERNLSAIVRTCDAVGIGTVHSIKTQSAFYRPYKGTSASAEKWVSLKQHQTVVEPLADFKQNGFQVVAAHFCEESIDYRQIDYTKPTILLMGSEIDGVSPEARPYCDATITIPMMGMVESFNVSVACAIILSEAQRQRQHKDMYAQRSISKADFDTLYFEWAYPKLKKFCDDRGLSYPAVREDGYLAESGNSFGGV